MLRSEVIKKARRLEISTRKAVNEFLAGSYQSVFKGRGMEFSEVREYIPGDDIRSIDWNVTARTGKPFVKLFSEERELTVILMLDLSSSGEFGSVRGPKKSVALEIAALIAFSAIHNNDRVGLIGFTDHIERYIPAKKGKKHGLKLMSAILGFDPEGKKTDIAGALEFFLHIQRRRAVVFIISDFLTSNFETPLRVANKKHDLTAIRIADPREIELPKIGLIELEDAETGQTIVIDTDDAATRTRFSSFSTETRDERQKAFRAGDIDLIDIRTDEPYEAALLKFFHKKAKRFR